MLWNLLSAEASNSSGAGSAGGGFVSFIPFLLIIGAAVILWIFSRRSQKKREEEINKTLDAIQPGCKVKTIGGICGVVVELCPEDNTFILETGSEKSGKSYIKFDKKAVYQTDANPAPVETTEETTAEPPVDETPVEEPFEETVPVETTEETPVEETEEVEPKEE